MNMVRVRLINDDDGSVLPTAGRLEVMHDGVWGTVCDDSFGSQSAAVVCRMLGLRGGEAKASAALGAGSGQIWLDEVKCRGTESSIFDCASTTWGKHDCGHGEDVGVICH